VAVPDCERPENNFENFRSRTELKVQANKQQLNNFEFFHFLSAINKMIKLYTESYIFKMKTDSQIKFKVPGYDVCVLDDELLQLRNLDLLRVSDSLV
jgi:hypothetical protein